MIQKTAPMRERTNERSAKGKPIKNPSGLHLQSPSIALSFQTNPNPNPKTPFRAGKEGMDLCEWCVWGGEGEIILIYFGGEANRFNQPVLEIVQKIFLISYFLLIYKFIIDCLFLFIIIELAKLTFITLIYLNAIFLKK